jgi:signal transduction histidine kinase
MLSRGDWIPDPVVRGHVRAEAAWLRRFVELEQEGGTGVLPAALHEVLDRHARLGLEIDLNDAQVEGRQPGLPGPSSEAAAALVGAVDEALVNVGKHAGVTRVTVRVRPEPRGLAVTVVDQGCGFDAGARPGLGLEGSVRARIREVGGWAFVESVPGSGTRVELWVPAEPVTD